MNHKLTFVFLTLLLLCSTAFAQRAADKVITFEKNIETILVNPYSGSVVVKDKDAISSYNPDTDEIEWKVTDKDLSSGNAMANAQNAVDQVQNGDFLSLLDKKKDLVSFIDGSPFISLTIDNKDVIINSVNGDVVYNSKNLGYRLLSSEYMLDERALLMTVINAKSYSCAYYDLVTKEVKWLTELSPVESFFGSLKGLFSIKPEDATKDMVATTSSDIFVTINGILYKIAKSDGAIAWKTESKINSFEINKAQTHLISIRQTGNILRTRTALNLLDIKSGDRVWKDDIVTKYVSYMEDAGDKLMVAHANGFNFFKYADGKKVWKKDAKGNKIKQVIPIGEDYLYVADKEMNLIDKDGLNKWKKFVQICDKDEDEVYHLNKIDNNRVFFLTDSYGNMVDYTTGKKVWKKDVKFNRDHPLLYSYDETKNVYIAYNDRKIYKFDPNNADEKKNEPFAKLKKVRDDKSLADIELFDWGVSLAGQEDVMGMNFDGTEKYHNTYKEPGGNKRGWMKFGQAVASTGLATYTAGSMMKGTATGIVEGRDDFKQSEKLRMEGAMQAYGAVNSSFMGKFSERFDALKANNEFAFVMNKAETGGAEIVKVNKNSGEEVDRVSIDDTKPIYEVDSFNDNLYYVKGKELRVYNKK